ncbi:type 1 glutamine amidotransferase domain-containing protein [Colwelliaceae bacterium 6471]
MKIYLVRFILNVFSVQFFVWTIAGVFTYNANAEQPTEKTLNNNKVLFVISSDKHGYWLPEVVEPYYLLNKAGYKIDIASPKGGKGIKRGVSRMDYFHKNWLKVSKLNEQLDSTISLSNINPLDYQAVYFAGGAGPMFDLIDNIKTQYISRVIYENNGLIAAACHGPAAVINTKLSNGEYLIKGKSITAKANIEEGFWARTSYPYLLEDKIKEFGGHYTAADKGKPHVVVDGQLITGQNPASAALVAKKMLEYLN